MTRTVFKDDFSRDWDRVCTINIHIEHIPFRSHNKVPGVLYSVDITIYGFIGLQIEIIIIIYYQTVHFADNMVIPLKIRPAVSVLSMFTLTLLTHKRFLN